MTLAITDLFQPASSGVSLANPGGTPASGSWLAQLLANAQTLGLPTTSWQSGGAVRTILALVANTMAQEDVIVSMMAQGGFLDFAATGTVTYIDQSGATVTQPVSPDPSVPGQNANGTTTWIDVLASSVYNVQRIGAQYASGTLVIANSTGNTYGPYTPGTYHVSNPSNGVGYSNSASLTIAAANLVGGGITSATNASPIIITTSGAHGLSNSSIVFISGVLGNTAANGFWNITVLSTTTFSLNGSVGTGAYTSGGTVNVCTTATFQADIKGTSGSAAANAINQATTALSGVSVKNLVPFFGQTYESNIALAARCRLKLQSLSPNGPSGAYKYFALSAAQLLAAQTPSVQLSSPITRVVVQSVAATGSVVTTVASAAGVVPGISNLAVTNATNASPIVITTASNHGLSSGDFVTISGVLGNTAANGTWNVTWLSSTTFSLTSSTGNAAYTSGGIVEGGDLGEVDTIIQANCVPASVTAVTQSATAFNVAIAASVVVPQAKVAEYQVSVQTALAAYFSLLSIGGGTLAAIDYEAVLGVLYAAGIVAGGTSSYVMSISGLTLNGSTVDVAFPGANSVAVLSPAPSITVTGA